ncbi:P-loop containing nucleoside triphosphate hydrolase protein [Cladochytrium replicatum]|nr:P-loop containing nucleoside triphosphate hydrolase protein [Cladochytrium replicatum]
MDSRTSTRRNLMSTRTASRGVHSEEQESTTEDPLAGLQGPTYLYLIHRVDDEDWEVVDVVEESAKDTPLGTTNVAEVAQENPNLEDESEPSFTKVLGTRMGYFKITDAEARIRDNRVKFEKEQLNEEICEQVKKLPKSQTGRRSIPIDPNERDHIVCVRTRPLLPEEIENEQFNALFTSSSDKADFAHLFNIQFKFGGTFNLSRTDFEVDAAFGADDDNDAVYHRTNMAALIDLAVGGGVSTIIAYGQTGSGKTYTISALEQMTASHIFEKKSGRQSVSICFFELVGNTPFDLLAERTELVIREDTSGASVIPNIREIGVESPQGLLDAIKEGAALRKTGATERNNQSSRSHAVCKISIADLDRPDAEPGVLFLVDLAGSESASDTKNHSKERIKEAKAINATLSTLKDCIRNRALAAAPARKGKPAHIHVPYRSSSLTKVLKASFELSTPRPCRTVIIACVSPGVLDAAQSTNTLRYIAPLKVAVPSPPNPDPLNPSTWSNQQLRDWIASHNIMNLDPAIIVPTETGRQMSMLSEGAFVSRCDAARVETEKARVLYLKFWRMLMDARTSTRKKVMSTRQQLTSDVYAPDSETEGREDDPEKTKKLMELREAYNSPYAFSGGIFIRPNPIAGLQGLQFLYLVGMVDGDRWDVADVVDGDLPGTLKLDLGNRWVCSKWVMQTEVELEYHESSRLWTFKADKLERTPAAPFTLDVLPETESVVKPGKFHKYKKAEEAGFNYVFIVKESDVDKEEKKWVAAKVVNGPASTSFDVLLLQRLEISADAIGEEVKMAYDSQSRLYYLEI